MGCLGGGAVAAGLVIGRCATRFGLERLVAAGCVALRAVMLVAAWVTQPLLVYLALVAGGAAWMAVMSTFNTATQTSVPPWVRARAVAMHIAGALGAFAIGSALWGALSDLFGLAPALTLAGGLHGGRPAAGAALPAAHGRAQEVTQATPWDDLFVAHEPSPEAGPVAVEARLPHARRAPRPSWTPERTARAAPARRRHLLARLPRPVGPSRLSSASSSRPGPTTCTSAPAPRWPTRRWSRRCALTCCRASQRSTSSRSMRTTSRSAPPWYFSARIVVTTTAALGHRPVLRHLMSRNFSAPRSAPKPASVTT
jgi:MFS family permease